MHANCPECHSGFDLEDRSSPSYTCPLCGAQWTPTENQTLPPTISMPANMLPRVAHFVLLRKVGSGSFGDVYQARDTELERTVAVKVLRRGIVDEQSEAWFLREGRAAARLRHPNIVSVHGMGRDGDTCYIISDFIDGVSLSTYLKVHEFQPREAARLCATVAEALHHAHNSGVVHRDLKPSNIMLDGHRQPYVMDFGLAKREGLDVTLTVEGQLLGTVPYMSPEQAGGKSHLADRRSDVYSLGVVLYELLTGSCPFRGSTESVVYQVLHDEPRSPRKINPAVPRDLETICLKALSKDPAHRYATAKAMADDLNRVLTGESITARRVSPLERGWRWCRRHPGKAASWLAIILLAAGLTTVTNEYIKTVKRDTPVAHIVRIVTEPVGARGVCVPMDRETGEPIRAYRVKLPKTTPTEVSLVPGEYLVVVELPGYGFHEVRRVVAESSNSGYLNDSSRWKPDGTIEWQPIKIPLTADATKNMAYFEGGRFRMGDDRLPGMPEHDRHVDPFLLDQNEFTIGDLRQLVGEDDLPDEIKLQADSNDDLPYTWVNYPRALFLAEKSGKRLPTEAEYEFAATLGGRRRFPWGDDDEELTDWQFGPVGIAEYDILPVSPPVYGLYSNVAEWTESRLIPYPPSPPLHDETKKRFALSRIVRGGTYDVAEKQPIPESFRKGPRWRFGEEMSQRRRGLGFRCVRSAEPRFLD